jgi:hypothetical protein
MNSLFRAGVGLAFLCAGYLLAQSTERPPAPAADLNQLMRGLFFPHSNVVFFAQRENPAEVKRASEPSAATDPLNGVFGGWEAVENSALILIDSADLLLTPGRTCSNGRAVPLGADWTRFVDQLREAGRVAYKAAQSKNMDSILAASEVLATACSSCHNRYRRGNRCQ